MKHVYLLWEQHEPLGQCILLELHSSQAKAERAKREWEAQRASDDDSSYFVKEWKVL